MKTIVIDTVVTNLSGEPLMSDNKALTFGEVIANVLITSQDNSDKMKLYILAQKFYKEKVVELDQSDFNLVKKNIETSKSYSVLVLGQILVMLAN